MERNLQQMPWQKEVCDQSFPAVVTALGISEAMRLNPGLSHEQAKSDDLSGRTTEHACKLCSYQDRPDICRCLKYFVNIITGKQKAQSMNTLCKCMWSFSVNKLQTEYMNPS